MAEPPGTPKFTRPRFAGPGVGKDPEADDKYRKNWDKIFGKEDSIEGKTLDSMYVENDENLYFKTTDGRWWHLYIDADCCSDGWVEHISVPAMGINGFTVQEVKDVDDPTEHEGTSQEVDLHYSMEMRGPGGVLSIEYRNSSNGYYGSAAILNETYSTPEYMEEITKDWSR